MSAFARHGINHLSASSINCWRETPGLWTLRYLAGVRDDGSPAANRGKAVEHGFELLLRGESSLKAHNAAVTEYMKLNDGVLTTQIEDEGDLIAGMMTRCAEWYSAHPVNIAATQLKIETWLDGVSIPIIGYVDFTFMDGPDVDLKTTKQCPSKPRPDHLRQIAIYWKARQRPQSLLYVTDKRHAFYQPEESELEHALVDLTTAAQSLEHFLALMPDADSAIMSMPMQTDHYTWSRAAEQKIAEITGAV